MARSTMLLGLGVAVAMTVTLCGAAARADHACDDLGEPGWSKLATHEIVNVKDGAPYRTGGDWFVDRTTTLLGFCNYINAAGNYSLRSYSLSPEDTTDRILICRGAQPVAPYAGACPP
jgi:hypothetical protein